MREKINEKLDKFYEHSIIAVLATFLATYLILKIPASLSDDTMVKFSLVLAVGLVAFLGFLWFRKGHFYSCGLKKHGFKNLLVVLPLLVVIAGMYLKPIMQFDAELLNPKLILLTVIIASEAGFCEEMMVRGLPLGNILCRKNTRGQFLGLVFLTAALFGLIHFSNLSHGGELMPVITQAVNAGCAGVMYGAIYLRTGSIIPSIVLHALWDAATFLDPANVAGDTSRAVTIAIPKETLAKFPEELLPLLPVMTSILVMLICAVELGYGLFLLRKSKWEEIKANFTK